MRERCPWLGGGVDDLSGLLEGGVWGSGGIARWFELADGR
jgi:hypothetical protein